MKVMIEWYFIRRRPTKEGTKDELEFDHAGPPLRLKQAAKTFKAPVAPTAGFKITCTA